MLSENNLSHLLKALTRDHIPFELDSLADELAVFLRQYRQLPQNEQITIRAAFGPQQGGRILRCASRLAARAVRNSAIDDVALGLLAVVLEGVQSDFRNTVLSLCFLYHSSTKLGFDPVPLFYQAADFGTDKARDFILGYLQKGSKHIREFGFEEGQGPEGFYYESVGVRSTVHPKIVGSKGSGDGT
jgi:hypothetical protein